MNDHRNNRRGASAAILLLIAAFSLLLTFAFLAPRPDAVAMQVGQTVRSTPSLMVISPLQPPAPTRGPRPSPFVPPTIDDPAIVAALWARLKAQQPDIMPAPLPWGDHSACVAPPLRQWYGSRRERRSSCHWSLMVAAKIDSSEMVLRQPMLSRLSQSGT